MFCGNEFIDTPEKKVPIPHFNPTPTYGNTKKTSMTYSFSSERSTYFNGNLTLKEFTHVQDSPYLRVINSLKYRSQNTKICSQRVFNSRESNQAYKDIIRR